MRGRKPTTGRYRTRAELERAVLADYYLTARSLTQVAAAAGVSWGVANSIVEDSGARERWRIIQQTEAAQAEMRKYQQRLLLV